QQSSLLQNINEEEVSLKEQIKEIKKDYQETKRVIDIDIDIENFIEYDRKINDKDQKREECIRDISNYRNHFEKLNKELTELENRKNKQELQAQEISIKVSNIKEMIENNQAKINHVVGDREAADYLKEIEDKQKNLLEKEKQTHKELNNIKEELSNKKSDLNALTVSMEKNKNEIENVQQFLESKTNEYGIREFDELEDYILPEKELDKIEEKIRKYTNSIAEIKGKIEMFEDTLKGREIKSEEIGKTKKEKYELEKRRNVLIGNLASLGDRIERIGSKLKEKKEYMKKLEKVEEELALIKEINDLVGANKFVEFVALRQLKYIAREASNRLLEITNDRYQLELDQNGEFVICDNYNGGVKRDCNTLSGGETFLTSLALALSLSSHIQLKGKAEMEFFFLDEGFGTLDTELLDIVMNSLESLKEERLSVGIISHVEELKNRVPVTLSVIPAEAGLHGTIVELKYK
ncbi:MAG: SbcC/MukB-like Walker B domain-containing protein, partial [bacterium]